MKGGLHDWDSRGWCTCCGSYYLGFSRVDPCPGGKDDQYDFAAMARRRREQGITLHPDGSGYLRDYRGRVLARTHEGPSQRIREATERLIEQVHE